MLAWGTLLVVLAMARAGVELAPDRQRDLALQHNRAGEDLMQGEEFEEAAREFRQAVELDPLLILAHYNLGQSFMALRRPAEAERAYRGAGDAIARLNSLNQREREALARAHRDEIDDLKSSIVRLRTGQLKGVPVEPTIVRIEDRIRVLESSWGKGYDVARVPAELSLALGSALLRQDKLEEAERHYLAALKANKKLGAAHNNLAVVYMLTGRFPEAHEAVRSAEKTGFRVSSQLRADLERYEASANR